MLARSLSTGPISRLGYRQMLRLRTPSQVVSEWWCKQVARDLSVALVDASDVDMSRRHGPGAPGLSERLKIGTLSPSASATVERWPPTPSVPSNVIDVPDGLDVLAAT